MEYVICATTGHFADDVSTTCAECAAPIVHRPHVPSDFVPICVGCAALLLGAEEEPPVIQVTRETLREVALYFAKTKGSH